MAELADAAALGAVGRKVVQVQVLFPAPHFDVLSDKVLLCQADSFSAGASFISPSRQESLYLVESLIDGDAADYQD